MDAMNAQFVPQFSYSISLSRQDSTVTYIMTYLVFRICSVHWHYQQSELGMQVMSHHEDQSYLNEEVVRTLIDYLAREIF